MTNEPSYVLHCRPQGRAVISDFFNPYGDVFDLLTRPPETRYASFGLRTAAIPELHNAEYWEVHAREALSARTRRLRVYSDGTVIFRASADSAFLCWPREFENRIVNPVVVADSIISFCRFVSRLLLLMSERPTDLQFGVEIPNAALSKPPLKLYPGRLRKEMELFASDTDRFKGVAEKNPARTARAKTVDVLRERPDVAFVGADETAFQLVKGFYDMFGLKESEIPYVDRDSGAPRMSVASFRL